VEQKQKTIDHLTEEQKDIKKAADADLQQKTASLTSVVQQKEVMLARLLESNTALANKAANENAKVLEAEEQTLRHEVEQKQKTIDHLTEEQKDIKKAAEADLQQKTAALTAAAQQKEVILARLMESNTALAKKAERDGNDFRGEVEHEKHVVHKLRLKGRKYKQAFRKWANEDAETQVEVRTLKSKVADELATVNHLKEKKEMLQKAQKESDSKAENFRNQLEVKEAKIDHMALEEKAVKEAGQRFFEDLQDRLDRSMQEIALLKEQLTEGSKRATTAQDEMEVVHNDDAHLKEELEKTRSDDAAQMTAQANDMKKTIRSLQLVYAQATAKVDALEAKISRLQGQVVNHDEEALKIKLVSEENKLVGEEQSLKLELAAVDKLKAENDAEKTVADQALAERSDLQKQLLDKEKSDDAKMTQQQHAVDAAKVEQKVAEAKLRQVQHTLSSQAAVLGHLQAKVSSMNSWNSSINELHKKLDKAAKESTVQKDTIKLLKSENRALRETQENDTAMARCKEQVEGLTAALATYADRRVEMAGFNTDNEKQTDSTVDATPDDESTPHAVELQELDNQLHSSLETVDEQ